MYDYFLCLITITKCDVPINGFYQLKLINVDV